jgi:hypothetical protein
MRWWTKLLIPVLMLGLVGIADAKGTKKTHVKHMKGKIVSISGTDVVVAPHHKKKSAGKTATIHTSAQTKITIHGVSGKAVADLKAGEKVSITHSHHNASKITVAKKKHHHKKK